MSKYFFPYTVRDELYAGGPTLEVRITLAPHNLQTMCATGRVIDTSNLPFTHTTIVRDLSARLPDIHQMHLMHEVADIIDDMFYCVGKYMEPRDLYEQTREEDDRQIVKRLFPR